MDERDLAELIQSSPDVSLAYLFGSIARGEARRGSDLDIAVLFTRMPTPERVAETAVAMERAVGQTVDLVVLNGASPLLAHEAVATGRLLACRDDARARTAQRWPRSATSIRGI